MKTVKRIIAVVILCVVVLLVGYSCYTGSRLTSYPQNLDGYKNKTFYTNDGGPPLPSTHTQNEVGTLFYLYIKINSK